MSVLVTGGSGTLGAEVCRHLIAQGKEVVALGRDKSRLLANCPPGATLVICDVRDLYRLMDVCRRHDVAEVVHCAANKHVGVCEEQPAEAVQTNVIGTANVLTIMRGRGITKGVFVSSDKATDSTVYGTTKHLGERLVSEMAWQMGWPLNCVRPGNIIGSAGSVVDIWTRAFQRGDPITLNVYEGHAARRFVMLPSQAARLVVNMLACTCRQGTVVAYRMPVVDMRTLATVIAPGAPIIEQPLPSEWLHQTLIGEHESAYLQPRLDELVLDRSLRPFKITFAYSTRGVTPMSFTETTAWLAGQNFLPTDVDHHICS